MHQPLFKTQPVRDSLNYLLHPMSENLPSPRRQTHHHSNIHASFSASAFSFLFFSFLAFLISFTFYSVFLWLAISSDFSSQLFLFAFCVLVSFITSSALRQRASCDSSIF